GRSRPARSSARKYPASACSCPTPRTIRKRKSAMRLSCRDCSNWAGRSGRTFRSIIAGPGGIWTKRANTRPNWRRLHQTSASPLKSAPNYRGVPGLVRKYYLYGDDRTGGGVYLWNSREAAERFYSEAWRTTIAQRFGAQPEISFYDTAVIVENVDEKTASAA